MGPLLGALALLALLAAPALLASAMHADEGFPFPCPGSYNCTCVMEGPGEYELSCPASGEDLLSLRLWHGRSALLQCNLHTSPEAYALLSHVHVWPGERLRLNLCPLPDGPFTDLIQLRNAADIRTLQLDSFRAYNDSLQRQHFSGLTGITRLLLANNGLTALPHDLLMDLPQLESLDLTNNHVQLPADIFQPVLGLQTLDLGSNELATLPVGLFRNLRRLDLLNLWKNKLKNLYSEMFSDLESLTSLDLSNNGLIALPNDIFKYLTKLKTVKLNGNNFQALPSGLFSHSLSLETIQLYDNRDAELKLPNGLLANLTMLKTVNLYKCGLKELPEDIFWGSTYLQNISLQSNHLRELPHRLFKDAENMLQLKLSYNQLSVLPDQVLSRTGKLRILDLSFNKISNLSKDVFYGLGHLEELNLKNNILRHINNMAFHPMKNLRTVSLANNELSFLDEEGFVEGGLRYRDLFGEYSPLKHCTLLERVDLFNNSITEIFADWRVTMTSLRLLNLSHNELQTLSFPSVTFTANCLVDVRHNNIHSVELAGVEAWALAQQTKNGKRQKWLLDGNPIWCNCTNYDLLRYFERSISPEVLSLIELDASDLTCAGPEEVINERAVSISSRAVTCPLGKLENTTMCPEKCSCHWRPADTAIIVDCINANLTLAPKELPTATYANHTELYLTHNRLKSLPHFDLPGYKMVTKIAAGFNNISSLNLTTLPRTLQDIELDHNNLTFIDPETIRVLTNLTNMTSIALHDNPWICECQLQPLVGFVQVHYKQVRHPQRLICEDNRLLTELTASGLCTQASTVIWVSLIIALMLGFLIGGTFAIYYRFTHEIKAWLYAHNLCLWLVTEEELDKDKVYDAFVSYSHKDEDFVVNELVPGLESGPMPFKLCLHYRDWLAGEWIPNQITRSVEASRRTLVVLSPNFLESVWGRMEFRTAHCQALNEGRARVIVVLLGDIGPTENLDPELRAYLNMNTYVKWGDPWFWKKLRYALPHPPKLLKNSMGLANRSANLPHGKSLDDKIELICEPTTPTPVATLPSENGTKDPISKNDMNGAISSPRKVPVPVHETNGTAAAVG